MDEPFGSLDAMTKERLQVELTELWEKTKKTVLFITHDLEEALFLGDRVAVMQSIAADVPIKIFEVPFSRPRNKFLREDACFQEMRRRLLVGVVAPMNKRRGEVPSSGRYKSLIAFGVLLLVWSIITLCTSWIKPIFIPSPLAIAKSFYGLRHQLLVSTGVSLAITLTGFGIGLCVGIALGLGIAYSKTFMDIVGPFLDFTRPVPVLPSSLSSCFGSVSASRLKYF